jgi:hypothetical protein
MKARLNCGWANKTRSELHTRCAHLDIRQDRLAAADAAGDKYRHFVQVRQHLLRQNGGRHRADMTTGLAPLDDDRVRPHTHELLCEDQRRRKAQHLRAGGADPLDCRAGRYAASQYDVANALPDADIDQFQELRMHRDQVDAERALGERLRRSDFLVQQFRLHRARRDDAEAAGIRDGRNQVALGHPRHRPAHDGEISAEKSPAARPQPVQFRTAAIRHYA